MLNAGQASSLRPLQMSFPELHEVYPYFTTDCVVSRDSKAVLGLWLQNRRRNWLFRDNLVDLYDRCKQAALSL